MSAYPTDFADRFAAMQPDPVECDWLDVQRRARASRKRHLLAYALAAAFAIVLVGCSAAFGPRIVSFVDSEPSPPHVLDELSVNRAAYEDYDPAFPGFDEKETRRVVDRAFAGGTITIDLTPLKGGGFCYLVDRVKENGGGGSAACLTQEQTRSEKIDAQDLDGSSGTGGGRLGKREGGMTTIFGWVAARRVVDVRLRYEDGTSARLDYFRVTKPIDTAFFLFDVPGRNESYPRRASEVTALDDQGNVIARRPILPTDPDEWSFPRYGSGGNKHHGFPPAADESRQRRLVFPGTDVRVWVAPARRGVMCFIVHTRQGSGSDFCPHDAASRTMFRLDENQIQTWETSPLLWGLTEPEVRRVDLQFQDGRRETTLPQEELVLYAIPERQYALGKRLVEAVLRDADGRVARTITFDPTVRDRYPCDNPKSDIELGPEHCP